MATKTQLNGAVKTQPHEPVRQPVRKGGKRASLRLVATVLVVLHLGAGYLLLPPSWLLSRRPLVCWDHPVHAHRVWVFREALLESGIPWGYDPCVSAGVVVQPQQDVGGKCQQLLGVILPFVSPQSVVRLFLVLSALTFPVWLGLACLRLRFPPLATLWATLIALVAVWLHSDFTAYFRWGLASFVAASFLCPLVLALFLGFVARPSGLSYVTAVGSLSLLTAVHVLGPVAIGPPLIALLAGAVCSRSLAWRWRAASAAAPLVALVLNGFWLVPFAYAYVCYHAPPWPDGPHVRHLTYANLGELWQQMTPLRVAVMAAGLALVAGGLGIMRRQWGWRGAAAFGVAIGWSLFLKFGGSFVPLLVQMQPTRFFLTAVALAALPAGLAIAHLLARLKLPQAACALGAIAAVIFLAVRLPKPPDSEPFLGLPRRAAAPTDLELVEDFIVQRTRPTDRILLQQRRIHKPRFIQLREKYLAVAWQREVIGCTFPDERDPAQFEAQQLWGRRLDQWEPERLREALERWGVCWAITHTPQANALLRAATGDRGTAAGVYRIFEVPRSGRLLVGRGEVKAKVNRIELDHLRAAEHLVVLKYRYHPAWRAIPELTVRSYPVPEDPVGFLALVDPPAHVVLRFQPWQAIDADWSAVKAAGPVAARPSFGSNLRCPRR